MVIGHRDDVAFVVCMEGHARPPSHRRCRSFLAPPSPPAVDHGAVRAPSAPRSTSVRADRIA